MGHSIDSLLSVRIFVLGLCAVCLSNAAITITSLDGGAPPTTSTSYDIAKGSTFTVLCDAGATIQYPTNQFAEFERFKDRVTGPTSDNSWTFSDVEAYDTGYITCGADSIYVFINDAAQLFVSINKPVAFNSGQRLAPCLPTYSTATVTFIYGITNQQLTNSFSPKQGFSISRSNQPGPYKCQFTVGGDTQDMPFSMFSLNINALPDIVMAAEKPHIARGGQISLTCSVPYNAVLTIRWSYPSCSSGVNCPDDDRIVKTLPAFVNSVTTSTLTVSDARTSDSGVYTCQYMASGDNQFRKSSTKTITVYDKSFVNGSISTPNLEATVGGNVEMKVEMMAFPDPAVQWMFNDVVLTTSRHDIITTPKVQDGVEHVSMLTINNVLATDAGKYMMTASVPDEAYIAVFTLVVNIPPENTVQFTYKNHSAPLTPDEEIFYVQPNQTLELKCRVTQGMPQPDIVWGWQVCNYDSGSQCNRLGSWTKNITQTQPDPADTNMPYLYSTTSGIQDLRLSTQVSGTYSCMAGNKIGHVSKMMTVIVSPLPETSKGLGFSKETTESASQLVDDDHLLLTCYVSRSLCTSDKVQIYTANIYYDKDSAGLTDWQVETDWYKLAISVHNISLTNDGDTYNCRCRGGMQGPILKLSVESFTAPGWAKQISSDITADEQTTHSFICEPEGRPLPKVTWYKDGKVLVPSYLILISENKHNMTILKVGVEDAGSYSCVGETDRDTIYSNFTLTVNAAPPPLSDEHIVLIVCIIFIFIVIAIVITVLIVRKYCRKKYTPHQLLLPSKEMINPDIPLDEQTDALPYDIGWEFPIENLKLGMLLGQGAFGRVLKAECMNIEEGVASTTAAVKTVRDHHDLEQIKALISELKILIHIGQHLNIVNLLGACTKDISKGHIMVIVEFCRFGNLRSYLLKHKANFNPTLEDMNTENSKGVKLGQVTVDIGDEDYLNEGPSELHSADKPVTLRDIMSWCYQIARGMEYLASIDYIHRDLAARNVLLADDNIVKICDFGLAKDIYKYQEYQKQTDGPLPIKWMALESLTHKVFNVRTDVWAYGITIWELYALAATPYPGWEIDDTFIDKLQEGYRMEKPTNCPENVYREVMLNCWHPDPEKRPNFAELAEMMGETMDEALKQRLQSLEDPYLRTRDSRTDITIRQSSVRRRDPHDLESDYLRVKDMDRKTNGTKPKLTNYYNTSPSGSGPSKAKSSKWNKENATHDEKLPLHVAVDSDESDEVDIPEGPAPSPSPWERQSHLGKLATNTRADDSHSYNSVDSEGTRPPSYNYVMKKSDSQPSPRSAAVSPAGRSPLRVDLRRGSGDQPSEQSYIETTC